MASITASRVPATENGTPAEVTSSHPYTCNTCQVAFRNSELQRGHMRTDWHRYNLKRRVTSLPPISSEVFTEKVLQAQASSSAAATKAAFEKNCTVCVRTYFSENAYQNHLGSQKHKAKLAAAGERRADDDTGSMISSTFSLGEPTIVNKDEIDSDAEDEFNEVVEGINKTTLKEIPNATRRPSRPHHSADLEKAESVKTASSVSAMETEVPLETSVKRCLFCNFESPSIELNIGHMERLHGMFIPERDYLVDLQGLVASLYEKIHEFHECLYCGKLKPSVFGLQTHMRDKGHCKIPFGTEDEQLEIGEYYDFRSTYSDFDDEESSSEDEVPEKQSGGVKLGAKRKSKKTSDDDEEMENADGWETDSSESSLDSDDLTALPLDQRTHAYQKLDKHPHHTNTDPRPHHNADGYHSHAHKHAHAVFHSEYELHLPSGRTAGHRSLNKYFRQNLVNHPSPAERQEQLAIEAARGSDSSEEEVDERVARRNERERGRALTSRANGGLGMVGVTAEKKKEVAAEIKRSKKVEERARRRYEWGNNKQSNMQKHFRDPLLQ